jgi:hypothetical protein
MPPLDLARQRLYTQRITGPKFEAPAQVVGWLCAVQAQDYAGAKWAVALRARGLDDRALDRAFNAGDLLRTHVLRPTWHFVLPADIRWLLALTAPRVNILNGPYYRKFELDQAVFKRSQAALVKALRGGKDLIRAEAAAVLAKAGIVAAGQRFSYVMMRAELDGVVCSGALRGKQHTYALLAERAPQARTLGREEALAELALRFFTGHGPATLKDYSGWSGLTVAEAKAGLAMVKSRLHHEDLAGQTFWFAEAATAPKEKSPAAHLLSIYDEYVSGYKDRSAMFDAAHYSALVSRTEELFNRNYILVLDGRVVGTWTRTLKKDAAILEIYPFNPLTQAQNRSAAAAAARYSAFLGLPVTVA